VFRQVGLAVFEALLQRCAAAAKADGKPQAEAR
jgi:hypothetical protein